MSVLNDINNNSLYDISILTDGNNNIQFTDPVEAGNILPPFNTTNANNILGVNTYGTQLEYKQNSLLPTINALVSGRILSNNGTNALWVLNPSYDLTQFHSLIDGSVSAPTLSPATDSTSGIYFTTQEVDIAISGVKQLGINTSGINSSQVLSNNGFVATNAGAVNNLSLKNGTTSTTGFFCRDSTQNCGVVCNGTNMINVLTTGSTIATSTTTPKIILTQTVSNSDPQIQSSTDTAPKCGINISENNVSIVTEGNIAATFANGQINFYKPCIIQYEANAIASRTGTITATNTDNKVQKLNYTSADCIYILPTGLNDGTRYELIPFKTAGAFACYIQVGTGATISTIIGGVKTNYSTAGTNIALTEGYAYNCIYQSSITAWIVWRSS